VFILSSVNLIILPVHLEFCVNTPSGPKRKRLSKLYSEQNAFMTISCCSLNVYKNATFAADGNYAALCITSVILILRRCCVEILSLLMPEADEDDGRLS